MSNFRSPAIESSIAVEDAVENRNLYRIFVLRLLKKGFRHKSTTIARLSLLSGLEPGGWEFLVVCGCKIGEIGPPKHTPYRRGGPVAVDWVKQGEKSIQPAGGANNQRKAKGQQLKGKIVSALFQTFWHSSTHFHTFSGFFRIFPPELFLWIKGFYYCFSSKRRKENKRE